MAAFDGLGFAVFGARLDGPSLNDDTEAAVQNETLGSFTDVLWPPVDTPFVRQSMGNLSLWLDRVVFGIAPETVPRTNLILHVLCVVIGMLIVRCDIAERRVARPDLAIFVALGAGLLALAQPPNFEVAHYASPRSETVGDPRRPSMAEECERDSLRETVAASQLLRLRSFRSCAG